VRHRLRVEDVVDGDEVDAGTLLPCGAKEVPADTPETVDPNPNSHALPSVDCPAEPILNGLGMRPHGVESRPFTV
jgi:hypothetical protein